MRIAGVASAFPEHYYKQELLVEALKNDWKHRLPNPEILDRLDESMQVDGRFLVETIDYYENLKTWGQANDTWIRHALDLGEKSLCRALARAGLEPRELSAIFVTSVTGIAAPSLDARLANRMGLSPNIKRIPIFGLGCVAGAAGISRAADYVRGFPDQAAALLSIELCSLTLQRDDLSMAHLISALLFGDGAAAAVVVGSEIESKGPEILATKSILYPNTERVMGWDISEKGFRIVLSPEVPDTVTNILGRDVDEFLAEQGLQKKRCKELGDAYRGPESSRSHRAGAEHHRKGSRSILEMFAKGRQHFFYLRIAGFGGRIYAPAPRPWRAEYSRCNGAGLLL